MPTEPSAAARVSAKRPSAALLGPYGVPSAIVGTRDREVRAAAADVDDPAAPRARPCGRNRAAAEIRRRGRSPRTRATTPPVPPRGTAGRCRRCLRCTRGGRSGRARVSVTLHPALDVLGAATTSPGEREPADLRGDGVDLLARASRHGDAHARVGELSRDRGADPATAARDERDSLEPVRRHARSPPATRGSRGSRGRPDRARALARGRLAGRSLRSASSAGRRRRRPAPARTPCRARRRRRRATSSADASAPGARTQKSHGDLSLHLVRHADRSSLGDGRMPDRGRLELRGPDALARDVQGVVRAAVQEPVAVLVDRRPVAVRPHAREPPPVRLEVALGIAPDPAGHPGPGSLADELADLAAHRTTPVVEHVHVLGERRERPASTASSAPASSRRGSTHRPRCRPRS